jgi:hypothetical protein
VSPPAEPGVYFTELLFRARPHSGRAIKSLTVVDNIDRCSDKALYINRSLANVISLRNPRELFEEM